MNRYATAVLGFLLAASALVGQAPHPLAWAAGELRLEAVRDLDAKAASIVRAKADAQADLESRVSPLLLQALGPVFVDSSHTVAELAAEDPRFFESLDSLARTARPDAAFLSADLARLTVRWIFPLFGERSVTAALTPGREAPFARPLGFTPSRAFTGLVIHAQGPLPAVGTGTTVVLRPALFPRIWDENMDVVLERAQVSPAALSGQGMVGYLDRLDEEAIRRRAGTDPLRTAARAVYGRYPVDVVISREAARQLLSEPQNREALRQGRVCIVYDKLD